MKMNRPPGTTAPTQSNSAAPSNEADVSRAETLIVMELAAHNRDRFDDPATIR
jgi:hypothetical protein